MCRDTSIVVWIPYEKAYLVVNASALESYRDAIPFGTVREGERIVREYVAVSTFNDDEAIGIMADQPYLD